MTPIVAWENYTVSGKSRTQRWKCPFSEILIKSVVALGFNSDVAQWIACRAHRHSPLPGGSSIETRRRYFLCFFFAASCLGVGRLCGRRV